MNHGSFKKEVGNRLLTATFTAVLAVLFIWLAVSPANDDGGVWVGWLILAALAATSTIGLFYEAIEWWLHLCKEAKMRAILTATFLDRLRSELNPTFK